MELDYHGEQQFYIFNMDKKLLIEELCEILLIEEINFDDEIEIDSMSSLMLIEFFDTHFGISLNKENIDEFHTLNSIIEFIRNSGFEV